MSELTEIAFLAASLGEEIESHRKRAEAILKGRVGMSTLGREFRVVRVVTRFGGLTCKLWATGPILKKDGQPHGRIEDSCPVEKFEELHKPDMGYGDDR